MYVCCLYFTFNIETAGGEEDAEAETSSMDFEPVELPDEVVNVAVSTTYSRNKRKLVTSPFMDKEKLKAMNVDYGMFYG